ncbi:MAG: alpha/beta fold hydrolase [Hyphomicrobiales bacterium]|nr:alpha/beta fold hydrolase [Hyphomicrobiales bacterium]
MANAPSLLDVWFWPLRLGGLFGPNVARDDSIAWTSANDVYAELPTMILRRFAGGGRNRRPIVVVAPFAVHDAGIADLAPGHSLVAALGNAGLGPVFLCVWKSATPEMAAFSIDCYLADLAAAVGLVRTQARAAPDLVGLCQGGWMSLLYAAVFPESLRRLVVAGAPIDTSHPSPIADGARMLAQNVVEALIASGGGVVDGAQSLAAFRASGGEEGSVAEVLQSDEVSEQTASAYDAWNKRALNLPGRYYADVLNWLFRENRLARGTFPAFGRPSPLANVRAPLYLLAGAEDRIAPPAQLRAAADLVGTPRAKIEYVEAPCGHLSLFMGARTLGREWRHIARWLAQ